MTAEHRSLTAGLVVAAMLHAAALTFVSMQHTRAPEQRRPAPVLHFDLIAPRATAPSAAVPSTPLPATPAIDAKARPETVEPAPRETRDARPDTEPALTSARQPARAEPAPSPPTPALPSRREQQDGAEKEARLARATYEQALAAWLDRHKYYPPPVRRRGLQGQGELRIRIDRGGAVTRSSVSEPSPHPLLDEVALDWVRRSDPFPAVPPAIEGETFEFLVPVRFELR